MYALLIILFTFFYTFVQINPEKRQRIYKRAVPISTEFVLVKVQKNICLNFFVVFVTVGSLFLGVISILPIVAKDVFGLSEAVAFGGTSL